MNVAEHLVATLVDEGVEVVFTVPGEQHDAIFRALSGTGIQVVQTRHEQAAAFMAYGYARSSGRIGVFLVISGPGVLYSTAALATAWAANVPVLCIATQISMPYLGRGLGVPHEIPEQLGVLESLSGWAARVEQPDQVTAVVGEAFHRLTEYRPRPVSIEIPVDVLNMQVTAPEAWVAPSVDRALDPAAIEAARSVLAQARAPMIYVGSGARAAAPEIRALAELLAVPVATEVGGRGILAADHELAINFPVAHRVWTEVDVVLAIGTRFRRPLSEWGVEGLRIIRIDLDDAEIRKAPVEVAVVGDAADAVRALLDGPPPTADHTEWVATVAAARRAVDAEIDRLTPQVDFLRALRAALPADGYFVDELTQVGYVAWVQFPVSAPSTYISSTNVGALGFGFATALGVKVAHPDRPVLSISGDGGFLYTAVELATAVQHGIGVVAVVFDDGSYANVERSQRNSMPSALGTALRNPDFVAFAEAFGAVGVRAHDPEELRTEIDKAFARTGTPTVIVVPVGEMPTPWPLIRLPRVR
ncbi:thiamine pyrophosphate-dependent enzyme [Nocardia stercoris]|uniref:acetolactate synthase n=1 Tax=Nocardia stercoris TaxID=2483361 RepID=A0A3M2L2C1_9NOCA|nr:thiamine pyrophosphate-dependent enzyme [Nocardia stercoris]RMI31869.1 hypothetical protein EBN03_17010 [Nocardia stercoris]